MDTIPNGIIKEIRGELGKRKMTFKELSERSGVSYASTLRKLLHQTRPLTLEEINSYTNALGVKPSELFEKVEKQQGFGNYK